MEQGFIDILKRMMKEQGKGTLTDLRKCKLFLADYTKNEYKKEMRLLLQAVEGGVAAAIDGAGDLALCKKMKIRELEEDHSLNLAAAADIVNTLALVLRGDTNFIKPPSGAPAATPAPAPTPAATPASTRAAALLATPVSIPLAQSAAGVRPIAPAANTNVNAGVKPVSATGIEMVWIPAGSFKMGNPAPASDRVDAEKQHPVTLTRGFYMGKYQVTQRQWKMIMGKAGKWDAWAMLDRGKDFGRGDNFPMYYVSWYDVIIFCNRLSLVEGLTPAYRVTGVSNWNTATAPERNRTTDWDNASMVNGSTGYRLPTEAQWEYACRAGTTTAYNTGNSITNKQARFDNNSAISVGSYAPNAWGLYDMHGNVSEWCWDWYGDYPGSAQTDPIGKSSGWHRVVRGGSWIVSVEYLQSMTRGSGHPLHGYHDYGFRLVRP